MLQPWGKQVSSVAELVLAFRGPFAIILAQNYPESGPSFLSYCYIPKHLSPQAVQLIALPWACLAHQCCGPDDLLSVPCRKAQTAPHLRDSRFLHTETRPHSRLDSTLALQTTCSAWHSLPLKCPISYEASTSNPVRTNPPFTHMPIGICSTHLEFYSFSIPT